MSAIRRCWSCTAAALFCAVVSHAPASAQDYPANPIRIVSSFAADGGNEVISRTIATRLAELAGFALNREKE